MEGSWRQIKLDTENQEKIDVNRHIKDELLFVSIKILIILTDR